MSDSDSNSNPDLQGSNNDSEQAVPNEELLRRLIRLVVGMALIAQDTLRRELPAWEAEAAELLAEMEQSGRNDLIGTFRESTDGQVSPPNPTPWFPQSWEYRLVGLAFASPRYIRSAFSTFLQAPKTLWRWSAPLRLPLDYLGLSNIPRGWLENLINQVNADLEQLEQEGEEEALPSRGLAYIAISKSYEGLLNGLAQNPDVQQLIQQQSMGLTTEVMGEVRERAVGLDIVTDAIMRRLVRARPTRPSPHSPNLPPDDLEQRDPTW